MPIGANYLWIIPIKEEDYLCDPTDFEVAGEASAIGEIHNDNEVASRTATTSKWPYVRKNEFYQRLSKSYDMSTSRENAAMLASEVCMWNVWRIPPSIDYAVASISEAWIPPLAIEWNRRILTSIGGERLNNFTDRARISRPRMIFMVRSLSLQNSGILMSRK